ncbi:asparaginase [soil metagenome]
MFEAFQPLAVVTRAGVTESLHTGAVVGLDAAGLVVLAAGDPGVGIVPRSCWKPIQAMAMVEAGLSVPPDQLAVVSASHAGTPGHLSRVAGILADAGLSAGDLRNVAAYPLDVDSAREAIRSGADPSALFMNCSGKHAGMLATCVVNRWETGPEYLDLGHPLQRHIVTVSRRLAPEVGIVGPDGCGAPAVACSLLGLARAFRHVALSGTDSAHSVRLAMIGNPVLSAGRGRVVTDFMTAIPGLLAKEGAEGVFAAVMPDGRTVAMKIADGSLRPVRPLLMAALGRLGVDVGAARAVGTEAVNAGGRTVGEVRVVDGLFDTRWSGA